MASSRDTPRRARLTITRDHPSETISSLADLVQALDGLTVPCGWLSIVTQQVLEPGEWLKLRQHLRAQGAEGSKARDRFYPWFGNELTASIPPITLASWNEFLGSREVIDPGDPLDIGLQYGLNAWFRNSPRQIGDKADDRVFAFAAVKRIQHESPILVETIITGASLGGLAFYRIVKAIYDLRKARAKARGEELDTHAKEAALPYLAENIEQEARQARAVTRQEEAKADIYEDLRDLLHNEGGLPMRDMLARAITEATSPAVDYLLKDEVELKLTDDPGDAEESPSV
jgi:hypothetical protein